jgi:cytochrome c553
MSKDGMLLVTIALIAGWSATSQAADTSGKAAAQKCVQCHEADDWEGESAASLESLIRDIAAGKVKHKVRIELSEQEVTAIAAYWGRGGK